MNNWLYLKLSLLRDKDIPGFLIVFIDWIREKL